VKPFALPCLAILVISLGWCCPCASAEPSAGDSFDPKKFEENPVAAVKWLRLAAAQGHANAQYNLGVIYLSGSGVPTDLVEAAKWFEKSAGQNHTAAQYNLGVCYRDGLGLEKDLAGAVKWFRTAAERNYAKAQHNLAVLYRDGQGVAQDDVEAAEWYHKAAEQNFAEAQSDLGMLYANGRGVTRDFVEAAKWFRKSAEQGYGPGQYNLATSYQKGQGVEKNPAEAVKWFRKAAEQNLASAQINLGGLYFHGEGVGKDEVETYKWTLLAAAQGAEIARKNLPGLERRLTPEQWADGQKRAAEVNLPESPLANLPQGHPLAGLCAMANAGDATAQHALGEAFFLGKEEAPKDPTTAVRFFRQAAERNHPAAQNMLGICYERGEGVAKYQVEAYKWFLLAAAQGNDRAKDNASALQPHLLESQITEAKQRVEQFKPLVQTVP
jgi:TPR repeat protein